MLAGGAGTGSPAQTGFLAIATTFSLSERYEGEGNRESTRNQHRSQCPYGRERAILQMVIEQVVFRDDFKPARL